MRGDSAPVRRLRRRHGRAAVRRAARPGRDDRRDRLGSDVRVWHGLGTHYSAYKGVDTFAPEGLCAIVDVTALPDPAVPTAASYIKRVSPAQQLELFAFADEVVEVGAGAIQDITGGGTARFASVSLIGP